MKTQKFALLIALFSLSILSACKKDDDAKPKSKTDMLASAAGKKWVMTAATFTFKAGSQTQIIDALADVQNCDKDDVSIFFSNKKFEGREGATKCNTNDPDLTGEGTWTFNSAETQLTVIESGSSDTYDIKELTNNTLKAEQTATEDGVTGTLAVTFTAQ